MITVAFVDVERSTELLVQLGDVEGLAAVASVLAVVRERIEPYGGREVKTLGDGLMLVFPAPRQAVAFAVASQRALLDLFPRVRIGVNAGEVTRSADDPVGESVNAAARIADRAAGGDVLVSDVVRQLVGTLPGVRFIDRGRVRLKGFPDRWRLFAAEGIEAAPEPPSVFGRVPELAALGWLLDARSAGTGRTLVLEGEAGIGKTHLVETARCMAVTSGLKVVAAGADELELDRPGRLLLGWAAELGASLTGLLAPSEEGSRGYAVIEAVGDALENAAAESPIVVVAEDLQWADELSLRGLASIARRLSSLPTALLVTLRPSPRPPLLERVLAALEPSSARRLVLEPLDDVAVTALTAALTGAPPGATLSGRVAGAAGNPLYVIELLRALEEDGALQVRGGAVDVDDRTLPPTLRDTIVRRLSALPGETVEVLRVASLLGREFALNDLATVIGRPVVVVASQLRAPVEMALLSGATDTLSFRHDLIREAVYDDIAPAIRRDLHTAAGRALADAGAPVAEVAQQFALAARPGDVVAVEWLERAAIATLVLDLPTAVSLFEQALALADIDWEGRTRLEVELLEPLASCGRIDEARALAKTLLDRGVDDEYEFLVHRALAVVSAVAGDIAAAVAENEATAALAETPAGQAAFLRCLAANMSLITGRSVAEVRPIAERALDEAQALGADDVGLACVAHQTLAMAAGIEGHYREATDHARTSRRLLSANALREGGFLIPDMWEAAFLLNRDQLDEAIAGFTRAGHRATRLGRASLLTQSHFGICGVHYLAGRWDDAVSESEAAIAVAHETGNHAQLAGSHAVLALVALGRGDVRGAETAVADGHQALNEGGHLFGVELLLWAQARLLEARNEPAAALGVLAAAWDRTASLRGVLQWRNLGPDLVRLAIAAGDRQRAQHAADDMHELATAASTHSATGAASRARGLADDDPGLVVEAVEHYRQTPRLPELAATCEDAGRMLLRHDQRDGAIAVLNEAAAIYLDCCATADVARIDSVLRAHNVRRRRHGPAAATHGWEAISPTERKVVELVAQGLSNPQIGATLFISRRTVETHLAHVFRKLDVASRAQLAAYVAAGAR